MFKKLQRQIDRKKAGAQSLKYRFDLQIDAVEGLPGGVTQCRVLWARGAKVQLSRLAEVQNGTARIEQQLTQVATVYRDPRNQLEPKEYSLKVEVPAKGDTSKMLTLGKAVIDMVRYINFANTAEEATVPIKFKVASGGTGFLKVVIHASMLRGYVADDGMTEVSGLTGLSSMNEEISEQDLSGFDDGGHGMAESTPGSSGNSIPTPSEGSGHAVPIALEGAPEEAPPKREKKRSSKSKRDAAPEPQAHAARAVATPAASVAEQELKRREEELQAAEAEIVRLKERLSESKEVKKERDSLVVQVKRLERTVNQAATVQQQLQAATSTLERIDAVGGVETVLQLVQDAGKHETAAAEAKQRVAAMEEVVHSAKEETAGLSERLAANEKEHRAAVSELGLSLAELHSQLEKARAAGAEATQGGSDVKAAQLQHDLDAAREQQERTEQSRQYLEAALAAKKAEHEQLRVLAVSRLDEVHELTESSRKLQASLDERDAELREAKAEEVRLVGELEVSRAEYVSASRQLASVSEAASATSGAEENLCGVTAGLQEKLAASETALERQRVVDKELTAALEQSRKEEAVVRDEAARADTAVMKLKEQVQAGHERADGLEESLHKAEQALRDTTDTLEEARAAHSVEMDALKGALARAEERVQSLEQQNAEQDARICELQEELEQESGHRGEEATRMKEVYDSRVAGLKRQIEEEQVSRRELEECFEQQLEEECRKAVDKEGAKQQGALERMKEDMQELRLRAAEDLELLEGRLLEANAEMGRLEKKTSEAQRANNQSVNEKLALERELLESASERTELEREINRLKKKLAERGEGKVHQHDTEKGGEVPVTVLGTDDKRAVGGNGPSSGPGEEEFMRIVSELALAKISVAEMEGERIKLKRDLYKQKEKYISVASKMTKLETKLMTKEGP